MRVLVSGSRHFNDYALLKATLDNIVVSCIIHGCAKGADTIAGWYGRRASIPIMEFPAKWDEYGRAAGPIRNRQMLTEGKPDLVVAFLAKDSKGTRNMIEQAKKAGIQVHIVHI